MFDRQLDKSPLRTGRSCALGLLGVLAAVGCGVHEYPHEMASYDPNNDLGPSLGAPTSATPPVSANPSTPIIPTGVAGSQGISAGAAGRPSTPAAGSGSTPIPPAGAAGVAPPPGVSVAGSGGVAVAGAGAQGTLTPPTAMPNPPASGVTLDLGGSPVAKENIIAFIHIGHSNMAGRAVGPQSSRPYFFNQPDPRGWMYKIGMPPQPAKEPNTAGDDLSGTYGGPGTALIKQAAALAPSKYFMSLGFGKTSAYCSQFLPGALYYDTLMKAPLAIKDRVTFGAIVIMLGITERHGTSADITGYSGCINKLVTAIRTDVGRPDLPLLITDYEQEATGALAVTSSFAQSVMPEIRKVPTVVSNSAIVPTDDLAMQDDHHFNFDGHKEWTRRVLQIMKDKGWFPWQ